MQRISRGVQILEAADVVDDRERPDVVEQRVDGEVAAERVFLRRAVGVVALDEPILLAPGVEIGRRSSSGCRSAPFSSACSSLGDFRLRRRRGVDLTAERGDLDGLGAELDVGQPEPPADDPAVPKQLLDLMRVRRRPDVEVLGPAIEQQVADAAADQIRDVVVLVEPVEDFESVGIDLSP